MSAMEHSRQNALSQDELDKLMDTVVFCDMDELVRVTNQAKQRGNDSTIVLNLFPRQSSEVGAQRNDRYKQTCSESPQANR